MNTRNDEVAIRAVIDTWVDAALHRDVARVTSLYVQDVVSFDAIGPLQIRGLDAWRAHWSSCMEQCPGDMVFRVQDVHVETGGGDIAFARFLMHCGATLPDGTTHSSWMRGTACYRRVGGEWKIAHDHCSVPFEPESCKALFDLQP